MMEVDIFDDSLCESDDDGFFSEFVSSEQSSCDKQDNGSLALGRILEGVVNNCTFGDSEILEAMAIFLKSDVKSQEDLLRTMSSGLGKLIAHEEASSNGVDALFYFLAKIAIRCHANDCELPMCVVRQEVDGFYRSAFSYARARTCLLISYMFRVRQEESDAADLMISSQKYKDSCIPSSLALQWASVLCQRRLDRDASVRTAALQAISTLPCKQFYDSKGNLVSANSLIIGSLADESSSVRETAISLVPLSSKSDIDKCLKYLCDETSISGRLLMAERIARNVHIDSFASDQLSTFLKYIFESEDSTLRCLGARQLIPNWLQSLSEEWDFKSTFGKTLCRKKNLPAFPSAFLNFLDVLDQEETSVVVMNVAFSHFMECSIGNRTEGVDFISFLRDVDDEYREMYRIHDKASIEVAITKNEKDLFYDLFVQRCLVQFVFNLYRMPHQAGPRDIALSRIVPNLNSLSTLLENFLKKGDMGKNSRRKFFCVRQICIIIRCLDLGCEIGRKTWMNALCYMISEPSFKLLTDFVEFGVHEVLEYVIRGHEHLEEFTSWLCYAIFEYFPTDALDTVADQNVEIDYDLFYRAGIMLNSILHYAAVESVNPLMRNAFTKLIGHISVSTDVKHRILGCSLVGLVCTLDDFLFQNYVHMLRHSLDIDTIDVKVSALVALTDIVVKRGFSAVGKYSYPELSQLSDDHVVQKLRQLLESVLINSDDKNVVTITHHLLRLMYCSCLRWPELIGLILYKIFCNPRKVQYELEELFNTFLTKFVGRGPAGGFQLVAGFLSVMDRIDANNDLKFAFGRMTIFVTEHLSSKLIGKLGKRSQKLDDEECSKFNMPFVFLYGVLTKLVDNRSGIAALHLTDNGLKVISLNGINSKNLPKLLNIAKKLQRNLEKDVDCESRVVDGVTVFVHTLVKTICDRNKVENVC